MTLLLDSHVLIWLATDDRRLGAAALAAVTSSELVVSAITVWELSIKQAAGRLDAPPVDTLLSDAAVTMLPLTAGHGQEAGFLPLHHRDPFDRALVAQARVEGLVLVTADPAVQRYDVALLDATR